MTFHHQFLLAVLLLAGGGNALFSEAANGANLIARWKLDETGLVHVDAGPNSISLVQDAATTSAISGVGIVANAAQLNWQSPGPATRLSAVGPALQNNSFGFSFWMNPVYLNNFDSLIGKETAYFVPSNPANSFLRMAWQVQVGGGTGSAALELVVRGQNGGYFGGVSGGSIPLHASTPNWIHVAGGYDAVTGALKLYVNGVEFISGNSGPNANNSDGSPLSIGTMKNGTDFVAFAAGVRIEDVQIYDGPLNASEVQYLKANPGQALRSFVITQFAANATNGSVAVTFRETLI